MAHRGTYKYICDECNADNWLSSKMRNSHFKPRCVECGSLWLKPSHASGGPNRITKANDALKSSISLNRKKMGKI